VSNVSNIKNIDDDHKQEVPRSNIYYPKNRENLDNKILVMIIQEK